jgi:hypothetical protein
MQCLPDDMSIPPRAINAYLDTHDNWPAVANGVCFPNLVKIRLTLQQHEWNSFWFSIDRLAPRLEVLDIDLVEDSARLSDITDELTSTLGLIDLAYTVTEQTFSLLAKLVNQVKTLRRVHLRGRGFNLWSIPDPLIDQFVAAASFQCLRLDDDGEVTNMSWHAMLDRPGACSTVETVEVGFPALWVSFSFDHIRA